MSLLKDTTTATSTSVIALVGGSSTFAAMLAIGSTIPEVCVKDDFGNWEIGSYVLTDAATLTRQNVKSSSNAGQPVTFPAGTKSVVATVPDSSVLPVPHLNANPPDSASGIVDPTGRPISFGATFTTMNKKLLVIGSSTAAGNVASPISRAWVTQLAAALTAGTAREAESTGWTVLNGAVPGWNTSQALASFYAPYVNPGNPADNSKYSPAIEKPDVVLLALALGNEGIYVNIPKVAGEHYCSQLIRRILRYRDMCRQIGARLILTCQWGRNAFGVSEYEIVKRFNEQLEEFDIPLIDIEGCVGDRQGKYRTGMGYSDGIHPNENGHDAIYRSCSLSFFDRIGTSAPRPVLPRAPRGFTVPSINGANSAAPLVYDTRGYVYASTPYGLDQLPLGSWTLAFKMKASSSAPAGVVVAEMVNVGATKLLRLTANAGKLCISDGTTNLLTDSGYDLTTDTTEHTIAMVFDFYTNTVRLFRDGVQILTDTQAFTAAAGIDWERFYIGGKSVASQLNAVGYTFRDIVLYRTGSTDDQQKAMANGIYTKASNEIFSPCADATFLTGLRLQNVAQTAAGFIVSSAALTPTALPA